MEPTKQPHKSTELPSTNPTKTPEPMVSGSPEEGLSPETKLSDTGPWPAPGLPRSSLPPKKPAHSSKMTLLLVSVVSLVLLLVGGGAAAYYGVVVPNKPQNVLLKSVEQSLQAHQFSISGKIDYTYKKSTAALKGFTADLTAQVNDDQQAFDSQVTVHVVGITLPVEIRSVDKNLYLKVGDLSTLSSLSALGGPSAATIFNQLSQKVSNQWLVIDESLLKQAKADCLLNYPAALSSTDLNSLVSDYKAHPFATVTSSSADSVKGQAATKYNLSFNSQKATSFSSGVTNLQLFKQLQSCEQGISPSTKAAPTTTQSMPQSSQFTVWVDKASKKVNQIEVVGEDNSLKVDTTLDLSYGNVSITAPANAKPVLQLLGDLSSLYQGSGTLKNLSPAPTTFQY